MIHTRSRPAAYQTTFANSAFEALCDAPVAKGGGGEGFGPHELLEAALATCLNMSVRMRAAERGVRVDNVRTTVTIDRSRETEATFEYSIEFDSPLSDTERRQLIAEASSCPVAKTLRKRLVFTEAPPASDR